MRIHIITCEAVAGVFDSRLDEHDHDAVVEILPAGLHVKPSLLRGYLNERLSQVPRGRTAILGYGLCGQATSGLVCANSRVVMPRVADCVSMLLGGEGACRLRASAEPGSYFMTAGTAMAEGSLIRQFDAWEREYGVDGAREILANTFPLHDSIAMITSGDGADETARAETARVAGLMGFPYREIGPNPGVIDMLLAGAPWNSRLAVFKRGERIDLFSVMPPV